MARHYSLAPNFRINYGEKEFITDDGNVILHLNSKILQFSYYKKRQAQKELQ